MCREHVLGFCEDVLNKSGGHDAKRDFAVNATERQVVNFVSKRRNIRTLCGIHRDSEDILSSPIQMRGEFERKWSVSPFVLSQFLPVDPDS